MPVFAIRRRLAEWTVGTSGRQPRGTPDKRAGVCRSDDVEFAMVDATRLSGDCPDMELPLLSTWTQELSVGSLLFFLFRDGDGEWLDERLMGIGDPYSRATDREFRDS